MFEAVNEVGVGQSARAVELFARKRAKTAKQGEVGRQVQGDGRRAVGIVENV